MRRWIALAATAAFSVCAPPLAVAQSAPMFRPKHFTVGAGALTIGGYEVGDLTSSIRQNSLGAAPPFTLLRAQSEFNRAIGFDGRVGFAVTQALAFEVGAAYAEPQLGVTVSEDAEVAGGASATERVQQYLVDVSGVYHLPIAMGRRARPYAIAGAGYLRQLHEGRLLVESGQTIHVGGGLHYWIRGGTGVGRAIGARAEARYVRRRGGVDFADRSRSFPTVSVLGFIGL